MKFSVVIAGRPNVGKSALFNRLLGRRRSLVHNLPGMTRDVVEEHAQLPDGRAFQLLDTGGYDPQDSAEIPRAVRERALAAIRGADLVVLVIDAAAGVVPGDLAAARIIHEAGSPAIVAANKIDRKQAQEGENEAWELGFPEVYGVSAEHGLGAEEILDAIARAASAKAEGSNSDHAEESDEPESIALAVIGRPNVGKSSLVNALLGHERTIVSKTAGTTRDSVDIVVERAGRSFCLVDTAGIRRKGKTERGAEVLSVVAARKRIEDCDVALLVVDAEDGAAAQDAHVASYVQDAGKGLILLGNKWDLVSRTGKEGQDAAESFRESVQCQIPFARHAPFLLISAKSKRGIARIFETAVQVVENLRRRVPTGELNRVLGRALRDKAPRAASGKPLKIYYVAQIGTMPPRFALVANRAEKLHFSEERRIENLLREGFDFSGAPIRISVRARSRQDKH